MNINSILAVTQSRLSTIPETGTFLEAARLLGGGQFRMLVVCRETGEAVGVVTRTDAVRHVGDASTDLTAPIAHLMNPLIVAVASYDDLFATWQMMVARGLNHVPVLDTERRPIGILTNDDALQALLGSEKYEEQILSDYVAGLGYR